MDMMDYYDDYSYEEINEDRTKSIKLVKKKNKPKEKEVILEQKRLTKIIED